MLVVESKVPKASRTSRMPKILLVLLMGMVASPSILVHALVVVGAPRNLWSPPAPSRKRQSRWSLAALKDSRNPSSEGSDPVPDWEQNEAFANTPDFSPSRDNADNNNNYNPNAFGQDYSTQEPMTTLSGGTALMFEMIRQGLSERASAVGQTITTTTTSSSKPAVPPASDRGGMGGTSNPANPWRPYAGVSDSNSDFRSKAPSMTNEGYARSMWRNLRKRHKPSLWKNALRTYDRMAALERAQSSTSPSSQNTTTMEVPPGPPLNTTAVASAKNHKIRRFNVHYEAAMLACAKLGLWQRALEIYHEVFQKELALAEYRRRKQTAPSPGAVLRSTFALSQKARLEKKRIRMDIKVTDDMILSLVKACVRASRQRSKYRGQMHLTPSEEEREAALRRIPLDTALQVLHTMEEHHGIPITPAFVNPLAKAYQSLGYISQSQHILQTLLSNRTAGEEPEEGEDIVNVNDFSAKNKASYGLLVEGAVATGDWGSAVEALTDMIDAGLYPSSRHSNIWHEISERQTRPRARGSRKKKRDDSWTAFSDS